MRPESVVCNGCGYDRTRGSRSTPVRPEPDGQYAYRPRPCRSCGYDLNGVVSPNCPECNTPIARPHGGLLDDPRTVARTSYRKALIGIVIGLVGLLIAGGLHEGPRMLVGTLITWPAAIIAYALVKIIWDALDEPLTLLSVRALAPLAIGAFAAILLLPSSYQAALTGSGLGGLITLVFIVLITFNTACEEDLDDSAAYTIPLVLLAAFGPPAAVAYLL
jgi:hypothetical protein